MTLILFDIDGTLTLSGQIIKNDMMDALRRLYYKPNIILGLVGGGTFNKIRDQVIDISIFKYIFAESGAIIYVDGNKVSEKDMLLCCDRNILNKIIDRAVEIINTLDVPKHTKKIDQRHGLLYISIPGIDANLIERKEFSDLDNKLKIRKYIIDELSKVDIINKFEILMGGEVGISISPKGFDKSQAISYLIENNFTDDIYFFGDKVDLGGNDYHIYNHKRVIGVKVNSYVETINHLDLFHNKN